MSAVENEHGYVEGGGDGPELAPYPPYVQSAAERRRWDVCAQLATHASALHESSGNADPRFVWYATRGLYTSDTPTGAEEVEEARTDEGREVQGPAAPTAIAARQRAHELLAIAQTRRPTSGAAEEQWRHYTHALLDVFDGAFGDAESFLPRSYYAHELAEAELEEIAMPFAEGLHPRSRAGKWTEKLAAAVHVVGDKHRQHAADRAAGHELKRAVKEGTRPAGSPTLAAEVDYHQIHRESRVRSDAERIAKRENVDPDEVYKKALIASSQAHVREGKQREGLSGVRQRLLAALPDGQRLERGATIATGETMRAIHHAMTVEPPDLPKLSDIRPRKNEPVDEDAKRAAHGAAKTATLGVVGYEGDPRQPKDMSYAPIQYEDAHLVADHVNQLSQWAADHADLIHHAANAAHIVHHLLTGIVAAGGSLEEGATMRGAMIALYPERDAAEKLAVDDGEPVGELHVTLKYLGDDHSQMSDELKGGINHALEQFAKGEKPLEGHTNGTGTFKPVDGEYPVYAGLDVPGIHEFRRRLVAALPKAGVMADTHPSYKPHVTLKYVKEGRGHDVKTPRTPLRFREVHAVYGGEKVSFPLGG